MTKSILITGANSGIGKDAARQFGLQSETEKVYLGCRNQSRAEAAKKSLEQETGRSIFEILLIDVSDLDSVRKAVNSLPEPVEALIMNAGGMGGKTPEAKTKDGVTQMFASNVLGHALLLEELLKAKKLTKAALYAGSEAGRGVPMMGIKRPKLMTSSVDEFASIYDGSKFKKFDAMQVYAQVKYIGALWMGAMARQYPEIRFVTMSPGGTTGTNVMNDLPPFMKFMFKHVGFKLMPMIGMMHGVEVGAKRFVDGINDSSYKSGAFYASKKLVLTGPMVEQSTLFADVANPKFQDNAYQALQRFMA